MAPSSPLPPWVEQPHAGPGDIADIARDQCQPMADCSGRNQGVDYRQASLRGSLAPFAGCRTIDGEHTVSERRLDAVYPNADRVSADGIISSLDGHPLAQFSQREHAQIKPPASTADRNATTPLSAWSLRVSEITLVSRRYPFATFRARPCGRCRALAGNGNP